MHAFHEVLANELARVAPKVGDTIGIVYRGKDPERGYHRYRVRGEDDGKFDWGSFGDPSSDAGPADTFGPPADRDRLEPFKSITERAAEQQAEHKRAS